MNPSWIHQRAASCLAGTSDLIGGSLIRLMIGHANPRRSESAAHSKTGFPDASGSARWIDASGSIPGLTGMQPLLPGKLGFEKVFTKRAQRDLDRRNGTSSSMLPAPTFQSSAQAQSLCYFRKKKPTITRQSCARLVFRNVSVVLRRGTYELLKIIDFRDGTSSSTSAADRPRPKRFPRKIYRPFRASPMGQFAISAKPANVPTYVRDRPFGAKCRRASRTPSARMPVIAMPLKTAF
jgi:hypothetical protein